MGYVSNWHDALEKCVIDGKETAVCEFGWERSFYGDGALRAVRDFSQDGSHVARAPCREWNEGAWGRTWAHVVSDLNKVFFRRLDLGARMLARSEVSIWQGCFLTSWDAGFFN